VKRRKSFGLVIDVRDMLVTHAKASELFSTDRAFVAHANNVNVGIIVGGPTGARAD
jgi:hypothetical protein